LGSLKGAISGCTLTLGSDMQGTEVQRFMQQYKEFSADRTHQLAHQLDSCPMPYVISSDCCDTYDYPLMGFSCTFLLIIIIRHPKWGRQ